VISVRVASADETRALGAALASALRVGDVVVLAGELGAGKTTFAQGVAAGLGVSEPVTSPTFVLLRPYECAPARTAANPTGIRRLLHADLYRLDHSTEVSDLALGELVEDEAAALVEWGDVAAPLLGVTVTVSLAVADAVAVAVADAGPGDDRVVTLALPADRVAEARSLVGRFDDSRVQG
jgi:tRNA threonylcarbamoyladenosine biosynthesis protein TsaE